MRRAVCCIKVTDELPTKRERLSVTGFQRILGFMKKKPTGCSFHVSKVIKSLSFPLDSMFYPNGVILISEWRIRLLY